MVKGINNEYKLNMDLFIIPNSARRVDGFIECFQEKNKEWFDTLANLNGYEADPDDFYVQIWGVESGALEDESLCENLWCHFLRVDDEEGKWYCRFDKEFLPYSILKNWKEGESYEFRIPATLDARGKENDATKEVVFDCTITPKQLEYRYCRFGTFEEVLEKVVH